MTKKELEEKFTSVIKNKNAITSTVVSYYELDDGVIELSIGKGFYNKKIWGVTVVKEEKHRTDLSDCFSNFNEAMNYIKYLQVIENKVW